MTRSFPATNAPTNALPTLPTPLPTILPTSIPTGANGTANACSPTPHTPRALEAPNAAGSRLGVPAAQGREGRKVAAYRQACSNCEICIDRPCIIHRSPEARNPLRALRGQGLVLPGRFPQPRHVFQPDCKRLIALLNPDPRPICPNHVASFGEGISRAGANSVLHSVEADQARARARCCVEMAISAAIKIQIEGGWGEKPARFHKSTCPLFFALFFRKLRQQLRLCAPGVH
ncbi:hypothetical protein M2171_004935 [Bradyrhizobium japonicum USDA 38]|nr:hypothetical protein [Bradyrhizobium japonicum USDA 38]MCS3948317.1 hypothetical protein [Bradyrhizobium japonicum]